MGKNILFLFSLFCLFTQYLCVLSLVISYFAILTLNSKKKWSVIHAIIK